MPTIFSKMIIGAISAVLVWVLYFGILLMLDYLKKRKSNPLSHNRATEKTANSKKINLGFHVLLILTGIIIGIGGTLVCEEIISNKSTEQLENKEVKYKVPDNWKAVHKIDIFGDKINDVYLVYDFNVKLLTGIRGCSLPASFIIDDEQEGTHYSIVISPDTTNKPKEDYGLFLKLWYKEEGANQSKSMLKFNFQKGVGYVPNLMSYGEINEWKSEHRKVRFKGFTTDSEKALEFENSPYGIDRKDADVFLNPEFTIQF